jgi:hypothetical protein
VSICGFKFGPLTSRFRPPSTVHRPPPSGFSRPEIVFFLACALIVVSLAVPAWFLREQRLRLLGAKTDLLELLEASQRYYVEYGHWPTARGAERGDARYGRENSNAEVVNVLQAVDGPGNTGHALNPDRIVFLEAAPWTPGQSGVNARGELIDPWGQPYQVVVDSDLNNVCSIENSVYGRLAGEGLAAWSCGPDRLSDTADDIVSWKLTAE